MKLLRRRRRDPAARARARVPAELAELVDRVRAEHLTYLQRDALLDLAAVATELDAPRRRVAGAIVEAGTALGGSAIVLGAAKRPDRLLLLHDVFGLIPPPGEQDGADVHERYERIVAGESEGIGGDTYYGYRQGLLDEVRRNLRSHGVDPDGPDVRLVQGRFEDTIPALEGPVALAHLDGDWYSSTKVCLDHLAPLMPRGGRFVVDDYDYWSGASRAVDDFCASPAGEAFVREQRARLHLVRR